MNKPVHNQNKLVQRQNNFFIPAVPPLTTTSQRLPAGWYYLGADSTVPFVTLIGGDSSQKTFTWGELVQVPEGQMVTVRNESYMKGDIQINSGRDYASKPARISTFVDMDAPVIITTPNGPLTLISSTYPLDTRLCRRAYVALNGLTGADTLAVDITGRNNKHSTPFPAFTYKVIVPPFTQFGLIPLGLRADINSLLPMAFTDQVTFTINYFNSSVSLDVDVISVIEY